MDIFNGLLSVTTNIALIPKTSDIFCLQYIRKNTKQNIYLPTISTVWKNFASCHQALAQWAKMRKKSIFRDNAYVLFTSKAKIKIFWKNFRLERPWRRPGVKKKFKETLILVFEVIVQPPKYTLGCCIILPQRFNQCFMKLFLYSRSPLEPLHSKKSQKTVILAFEANRALSCQNRLFPRFSSLSIDSNLFFSKQTPYLKYY